VCLGPGLVITARHCIFTASYFCDFGMYKFRCILNLTFSQCSTSIHQAFDGQTEFSRYFISRFYATLEFCKNLTHAKNMFYSISPSSAWKCLTTDFTNALDWQHILSFSAPLCCGNTHSLGVDVQKGQLVIVLDKSWLNREVVCLHFALRVPSTHWDLLYFEHWTIQAASEDFSL